MKNTKVGVIDLGFGNIASVIRMLDWLEINAVATERPDALGDFSHLLLPGVGHFTMGSAKLTDLWRNQINWAVAAGQPIMGICLGMQLLCASSEEGAGSGLNYFPIRFQRFSAMAGLRVPHMGWNEVSATKGCSLLKDIEVPRFYFVHSFYADSENENCAAVAHYGVEVGAIIEKQNIFGVQFHPEKSHRFGMKVFQNFVKL